MTSIDEAIAHRRGQRAAEGKVTQMPTRATSGDEPERPDAGLIYREDAAPPFDRFQEALKDRGFKHTLKHQRQDLPDMAAYDMELARFATSAGWADQEIVNLLIYHRNEQLEPLRFGSSYYADLLANARSASTPEVGAAARDADKEGVLEALNRALKIDVRRIVKYGATGGTFELQLGDGHRVDLGDAASVLSQRNVRAAIADATTIVVPALKGTQWDKVAAAIFKCAGLAPIEESPEVTEMRWLVGASLRNASIQDIDETDRAGLAKFIRDDVQKSGAWAFRNQDDRSLVQLGGLIAAIRLRNSILLTFKEAGKRLRKLGWRPRDMDGLDFNGRVCINVWQAPRDWHA